MSGWSCLPVLLLLAAAGCAGPDQPAASGSRDIEHAPWFESGLAPTADTIQDALYEDVHEIGEEGCPFRILTCADSNRGLREAVLVVENVTCRPVAEDEDRCAFDLVEQAGIRRARSRCSGRFEIVGHSHMPMRWGVMSDDYDRPRVRCRPLAWRTPAAADQGD